MGSFEENDNNIFMEPASYGVHDLSPRIGPEYQAEISFVIKNSEQLRMNPDDSESVHDKSRSLEIGLPISVAWSDADRKSFLLGLFIFGKNFVQIKRFLDNKGMGEILSFYYGNFYKSDGYRRWSECRKIKERNCIIGQRLFTGLRQRKLLSRLIPHVSKESQDNLLQVSKSYVDGIISLEEYISSLKSMVGIGVLVEAVGIGNEKGDLTRLGMEHGKNSRASSAPTTKALSSLGPSDIIQSLTGGYRLSKTKSTELFWEAVWPRLLARGWHSEKPKNRGYVTSEDYLVFLIPGVGKFSRRKLVKGVHYFDSVSDVLSKVVAEPSILELEEEEEEEAKVGSFNEEKGSNEGDLSDDHRQCYLKPRSSPYKKDHTKFTVIDTSLVHGGKVSDLRGLKSVPIKSVCKLEVYADGKRFKGKIYKRKVRHSKDMSKSVKQNSTKLTLTDTNRLSEGKLLNVKQLRYPPVEFEDASTMATGLLRESMDGFSTDDLPRMVEAKMLRCGKMKINGTDSCRSVSNSGATRKKEACDIPDNDANKMIEIQKSQQANVLDDNRLKRIIKNQFNQRVRSGNSNHLAVPIKRRRLTACAKAEERRIVENFSGAKGSDKLGFSLSSSFPDSNKNVCDPIGHQQNGSSTAFSTKRIVEENSNNYQCTGVSWRREQKDIFEAKRTKVCRLMSWLIEDEDSEYYQKLREFEYKKTARNKLNQVVLQKLQKSLANEVNRETDEAVIKTQQAEEKNAEEIKVKQVEAGKVKEMQEKEALASSDGNQLASTSSASNDDEVVILTKAKYERLLQSADKVNKLEEKLLQILNLLQQRNIVISDELTTQKVQPLNL
ncbi:arginine-glutamic acid dipeptide repeat protein [Trifolium repens]|nr:arginine-glutamic acid dipeptide repeat protein [Trifolium repens]